MRNDDNPDILPAEFRLLLDCILDGLQPVLPVESEELLRAVERQNTELAVDASKIILLG